MNTSLLKPKTQTRAAAKPTRHTVIGNQNPLTAIPRTTDRATRAGTSKASGIPGFGARAKVIALAALLAGNFFTAQAALKVGDSLPDLASFQLEGQLPGSLKGKVVVLDFWASWCLPCAESFPVLDELQKKYGDRLVVLAVNVDDKKAKMDKFMARHAVSFTVVRDAQQKLVAAAEPQTMPTSFILDGEGKVHFIHKGFHGEETRKQYVSEIESLLK